jgi:hypothetical protein
MANLPLGGYSMEAVETERFTTGPGFSQLVKSWGDGF